MIVVETRCEKCNRFLGIKQAQSIIATVRCPNSKCKHLNNLKLVHSESSAKDIKYKFEESNNG